MSDFFTDTPLDAFPVKLQKNETLNPEGNTVTRITEGDTEPNYLIARTAAGTYIGYGLGLPSGVEAKSIARVRKIVDLMAYEYAE